MNTDNKALEIRFDTKETAQAVKALLLKSNVRIQDVRLRKSLPEFKHHYCKDYSLFIRLFAWGDRIEFSPAMKTISKELSLISKTTVCNNNKYSKRNCTNCNDSDNCSVPGGHNAIVCDKHN